MPEINTSKELFEAFKELYIKYGVDYTELDSHSSTPDEIEKSLSWYLYNLGANKNRPYTKEDEDYIENNLSNYNSRKIEKEHPELFYKSE